MGLLALLLPTSSAADGCAVRDRLDVAAARMLERLPEAPRLIVLSAGSEPLVEEVTVLGLPGPVRRLDEDPLLIEAIVARGQVPRVQAGSFSGPAASAVARVVAARPATRAVAMTVAAGADRTAVDGVVVALDGVLGTGSPDTRAIVLLVPGDLGPAAEPGGAAVSREVLAALVATDEAALTALRERHPDRGGHLTLAQLLIGITRRRGRSFHLHDVEVVDGRLRAVGEVA